ncbi:MAG: hypothetical protein HY566_01135 [Candidatus Kerfeldbacteria bacterium]|nr:hypothetical protein [Candidatus Kerfeldbacteria bacterium]
MTPKDLARVPLFLLIVAVSLPLSWIAYGWDRLFHKNDPVGCDGLRLHVRGHGR